MAKFTPALALVVCTALLSVARAQDMAKPLGKWERKIGKNHVTLIVEDNRLHMTNLGEHPCTLHADYHTTKDGVVYGVITSVECDADEDGDSPDKFFLDAPFSCCFRVDEGALLIRNLRSVAGGNKEEVWNGRFKAVAPAPARVPTTYPVPEPSPAPPVPSTRLIPEPHKANVSSSAAPPTLSDNNFIEQYYKKAWPEALRPSTSTNEQNSSVFNFYVGFTR